jgi:transposase
MNAIGISAARAHTARATRDFLQQNNVNAMNWSALSPDLNPIEHLWDEINKFVLHCLNGEFIVSRL